MSAQTGGSPTITLTVPAALLEALAVRTAALVLAELEQRPPPIASPWLDFEAARAYLGFSRDRLYKLTAAHAIPVRKKQDGRGLLFHRAELDQWLEREYPATGCSP